MQFVICTCYIKNYNKKTILEITDTFFSILLLIHYICSILCRLSAKIKDTRGIEITTKVELLASATSYLMALPWCDAEYTIMLEATTEAGAKYPPICRCIRTLPYVHCK